MTTVTGHLFATGERIAEWTGHQFPLLDADELSIVMQVAEAHLRCNIIFREDERRSAFDEAIARIKAG